MSPRRTWFWGVPSLRTVLANCLANLSATWRLLHKYFGPWLMWRMLKTFATSACQQESPSLLEHQYANIHRCIGKKMKITSWPFHFSLMPSKDLHSSILQICNSWNHRNTTSDVAQNILKNETKNHPNQQPAPNMLYEGKQCFKANSLLRAACWDNEI